MRSAFYWGVLMSSLVSGHKISGVLGIGTQFELQNSKSSPLSPLNQSQKKRFSNHTVKFEMLNIISFIYLKKESLGHHNVFSSAVLQT